MFHKDTFIIKPQTFELIKQLQNEVFLNDFYLVGGTALALILGHRHSSDIDLFTINDFSTELLVEKLSGYENFFISYERENTLMCVIKNVKTDFIKHNYPFVNQPIYEEGIKFLSAEDIAAMKLNAIARSGKRLKDFIDIYYLLQHFSIKQMLSFYQIKYPQSNQLIALKGLSFFEDIDPSIDPPVLKTNLTLYEIKDRITESILNVDKIF